MASFPTFLEQFFPLEIIPENNITSDDWVVTDSPLFTTQWIDCSYPISGGYGRGPRYLYYALVLFALLSRRKTWLVTGALASVMAFSSAAAIHAMILAAIRTQILPQSPDLSRYYEAVMVGGNSPNGAWVFPTAETWQEHGLWLPVLPMVWDADGDAVLAVVGLAFLVMTPLQNWSKTFREYEGKVVLLLWSLLLLAGMICALVNEEYITFWPISQLRFCPLGQNDSLPVTSTGVTIGGSWDGVDIYRWNQTVTKLFSNGTERLPNTCLYPCFDTSWLLRDPSEIVADTGDVGNTTITMVGYWVFFAVYFIVGSSGLSSLTIFIVRSNVRARRLQSEGLQGTTQRWKSAFNPPIVSKKLAKAVWATWLVLANFYALALSPFAAVLFLVFIEWTMWYDHQGESFRHVGQWSPIVAALFVFVAAIVDHCRPNVDKWWSKHGFDSGFSGFRFLRASLMIRIGDMGVSTNEPLQEMTITNIVHPQPARDVGTPTIAIEPRIEYRRTI